MPNSSNVASVQFVPPQQVNANAGDVFDDAGAQARQHLARTSKIFKPMLHKLEVEAVVRSEATRVGATIAQFRVEDDPHQGAIVRIRAVGMRRH